MRTLMTGDHRVQRAVRLVCLLLVVSAAYALALWVRWRGHVPQHLWGQLGAAVPVAIVGGLFGAKLIDYWSSSRSLLASLYTAFVVSLSSTVAGMAAVYAFGVTSVPRLTFPLALILSWMSLVALELLFRALSRAFPNKNDSQGLSGATPEQLGLELRPNAASCDGLASVEMGPSSYGTSLGSDPDEAGSDSGELFYWTSQLVQGPQSPIMLLPQARELILASARFVEDGERLMLAIHPRACQWPWPVIKRLADVILSLVGLVVLSPVWAAVAVAIRLDSPGPVIFRQARVGERGRIFDVLKFRTMVENAEAKTGAVIAAENDPRITRVGRWLRALRLDELPQLINVLRGEMSLIGPRPERPEFEAEFRKTIEGYDLRHLVKPGITGLAQIRGRYDTPAEDKLRYELAYIFHWSPLLDLKIILQTIAVMLTPEQASSSLSKAAPLPAHSSAGNADPSMSTAQLAATREPVRPR